MTNRSHRHGLLAGLTFSLFSLFLTPVSVNAATWVPIIGNVLLADGTPICAMVLANGQYMFSCDGTGAYNLNVPLDGNGQITLFSFADGFAPFRVTTGPNNFPFTVQMEAAAPDSPLIGMSRDAERAHNNWVRISGVVESFGGDPLCAMVLANGQHMFTCGDSLGQYDLTVPVDENGQVTVFGFADGFQPYRDTFIPPPANPYSIPYTGYWEGFYSGTDTGTWSLNIYANGVVSGSGFSDDQHRFSIDGRVTGTSFVAGSTSDGVEFTGEMLSSERIVGTWINRFYYDSGTFEGERVSVETRSIPDLSTDSFAVR